MGIRPRVVARSVTSTGTGSLDVQARSAPPVRGTVTQRMFAHQGNKISVIFADFPADLDPEELLEFDALVAETGETSQMNDTAGNRLLHSSLAAEQIDMLSRRLHTCSTTSNVIGPCRLQQRTRSL